MKIHTNDSIKADFLMKNYSLEGFNIRPRVAPSQVHADNIIHITDDNFTRYILPAKPEADGVLLATSQACASLRFADCAPVMLWGKGWVMILHSGYKGTTLNISARGLELVQNLYGSDNVKDSSAWIGPCICREHYCRDTDDEWTQRGLSSFNSENYDERDNKIYFDLAGEIRSQLTDCGLAESRITLSGRDTFTDSECYSYRRGDIYDRMTLHVKLQERKSNL